MTLKRLFPLIASYLSGVERAPTDEPSTDTVRRIAEDAYVYAFPMLENFRTMYVQAIDRAAKAFQAPFNRFHHNTQLTGPEFDAIVRPNNDTLYSFAWLDLHAEPMVIGVPEVQEGRYYSFQLVDLYTHNFGYIGPRTTGPGKGHYLVAGPTWQGEKPPGITAVFRGEGSIVYSLTRTAVQGEDDLPNVTALQQQFTLEPLSRFLGQPSPARVEVGIPAFDQQQADGVGFVRYLNFLLGQVEPQPSERAMLEEFEAIGVGANRRFEESQLAPEIHAAIQAGIADAKRKIVGQKLGREKRGWTLVSGAFGNRQRMQGKYLVRAAAAKYGLYGNDEEEAYYPGADVDASGLALDASKYEYTLRLRKNEPPVNGFWSLTVYGLPDQLMVANPLRRYSVGDRTQGLTFAADGSLTIYIQHEPPDPERESNWLPAPDGPFVLQLRMYWPKPEALKPQLYVPPSVERANRIRSTPRRGLRSV